MGLVAHLAIHLIQLLVLYIALTYFGGLWSGAESQGRHGWIAAMLAAFAILLLCMGVDAIAVLIHRPAPDFLHHEQVMTFFGTDDGTAVYLFDLAMLFVGFSLYGIAWHILRARVKKQMVIALLVSVLLVVAEHGREAYL